MTTTTTISTGAARIHKVRPVHLLLALVVSGVLLVGARVSDASTGSAPSGCRGLSPASAQDCPPSVFAP
jgi:hypothetical protein